MDNENNSTIEAPKHEINWQNYAKNNCKTCLGRGVQRWFDAKEKTSSNVPCKCAVRNYIKHMRKSGELIFEKPNPLKKLFEGA